ncbi:hypothetical protein ASZ90_002103 [hydrocarbon metagenome]|uniref:Uncharacterized protein n=1 Tax=hydrocarbon metagenome TaxID=938273 RepID=A0A0W8G4H2_9ZZZZ
MHPAPRGEPWTMRFSFPTPTPTAPVGSLARIVSVCGV